MTLDLSAIRARLQAATPGPWQLRSGMQPYDELDTVEHSHGLSVCVCDSTRFDRDADFIAHAPEDIRALLAEAERLRRVEDAAKHLVGPARHHYDDDDVDRHHAAMDALVKALEET